MNIPKGWSLKRLDEVCPLQRGFDLPTAQIKEGDYPVVYSNGVINYHHLHKVRSPGVVTGRSGTIGKVTYVESDFWPHNTTLWVTNFHNNHPKYIYYFLSRMHLERYRNGTGVPMGV